MVIYPCLCSLPPRCRELTEGPDISGRWLKQNPCPIRRRTIDSLFLAWPRVLKPIRKICEISPKRGTEPMALGRRAVRETAFASVATAAMR
jgi:hypothetical protein